jgi:hypothetical protein
MLYEERRRDCRFAVTLLGTLARGRVPIRIQNAAYRGVLVWTRAPIVVGQLGQFGVYIPDEGPVLLHGVPVRAESRDDVNGHTLGVKLIGIEPRWEAFIRSLQRASASVIKAAPISVSAPISGVPLSGVPLSGVKEAS